MDSKAPHGMTTDTLITDFSRVYSDQGFDAWLGERAVRLDLTLLEGTTCYCDPDAGRRIHLAVAGRPERIHWIDSGDYHYVTKLLTDSHVAEPFTLVLFDNHPDDQAPEFEGVLSCGSWVLAMKEENPFLEGVVTVGPGGARPPLDVEGRAVWISVDKDILSKDEARTDWSQGSFTLSELEDMLGKVMDGCARVLGIDICGEFPPGKGGSPEDQRINLATNIELQQFIENHIK